MFTPRGNFRGRLNITDTGTRGRIKQINKGVLIMYFDSEAWIKGIESIQDVEEKPFNFEDFEEYEIMSERDFKNDL